MNDMGIDSPHARIGDLLVARLGGAEALEASARLHGAFQRARKIKSAVDLLGLLMSYAPGGRSLRVTAAEAAARDIAELCDVSLLERFQRCGPWLMALCSELLARGAAPIAGFEGRVRLIDGSLIKGPGKSRWRLHLCYDAGAERMADLALTTMKQGEKLERVRLQPGEIAIFDRGYPHADSLRKVRQDGNELLGRVTWNSLNMRDGENRPLDWPKLLAQAAREGSVDIAVTVHKPRGRFEPLPLRLVILPKPADAATSARKKAAKTASKNQHHVDPRTLQAAECMILITSLDAAAFPPQRLADLYRVRWQIELAIKRLKSILHIDRLPAKDPDLARTWIAAHLLLALLIDDVTAKLAESPPSAPPHQDPSLAPRLRPRQSTTRRHLAAARSQAARSHLPQALAAARRSSATTTAPVDSEAMPDLT